MITAIEIENFKAIGERVRVELKPLALLFRPNSAGDGYARGIFGSRLPTGLMHRPPVLWSLAERYCR